MDRHNVVPFLAACLFGIFPVSTFAITAPQSPGRDPRALYLRAGTVDTRQRTSLLKAGTEFDQIKYYILQLDGAMTPERRNSLAKAGVELGEYLPMYSYLAKLGDVSVDDLTALGFVSWVGEFEDAWKACPNIGSYTYQTGERQRLENEGRKQLVVTLFKDAKLATIGQAIQSIGGRIDSAQTDPAGDQLMIDLAVERIADLKTIAQIKFVEESAEPEPRNASTAWLTQTGILNNTRLWDMGLDGEGEIAGVIDWNLITNHCSFKDTVNPIGLLHRKVVSYVGSGGSFADHGTHVCGVVAGYDPALSNPALKGQAYMAKIAFINVPGQLNSSNLYTLLQNQHDLGVRVHNNSWGNGSRDYIAWARDIDRISRDYEEDVILMAPTNSVIQVTAPENAKNCLAVNATSDTPNQDQPCFGGFGPTTDGRQKPEIWFVGCGSDSADWATPCGVHTSGGTSFASPAAAAMCMLTRQYFMRGFYPDGIEETGTPLTPSGALLRSIMANAGRDMSGMTNYFGNREAWGRAVMDDVLYFDGDDRKLIIDDVRNADGLSTGQSQTYQLYAGSLQKLKITVAWTDVPAALMSTFTPVNNLDLVVTDPDGQIYYGNRITGAESTTGGSADVVNNTEGFVLGNPTSGVWTVEVVGTAINQETQGYGLVITGDVVTTCTKGDINRDGFIDGDDIHEFARVLMSGGSGLETCAADMNSLNGPGADDLDDFITALMTAP